jgi:hypothetical protein
VIDHVWVKSSLRDKYAFSTEIYDGFGEIEDNLYGGLSDHKPVILTIAKPSKRKRYHRYQRYQRYQRYEGIQNI